MIKTRLASFFVFMGIFAALFQAGSMYPVSADEAALFMEQFEDLVADIDGFGIFLHNTTLALPMFLPGFGMAWGMLSAWSTGYAFSAIVTTTPDLASIPPLAVLFLTPFGIMEVSVYSLGVSRSFILIRAILKKEYLLPLVRPTLIEAAAAVGILLAAGYIEIYMIRMIQEEDLFTPTISFP